MSERDLECVSRLLTASMNRKVVMTDSAKREFLTNTLIVVTEKINNLPAWFYLNNPFVKQIVISKPQKDIRNLYIKNNIGAFSDNEFLDPIKREEAIEELSLLTEGFSNVEMQGLIDLCRRRAISVNDIRTGINLFKYGEAESKWDLLKFDRKEAIQKLTKRVKGQDEAIYKVTEILSRAYLGLSSAQSKSTSRPRGVMFFAGPTGVGKTEMAKGIAELLFGDESFLCRFDMSEYQQSHSDQKLMGAPPGYVGYESGGQLTNAVKNNPFSVLLFDEIDKAHPSILDKFLQILDDGRMTDSSGETVHFSETIIVFTSNLGVIERDQSGKSYENISSDMSFDELKKRMKESISNYFRMEIGRPELLNRIGDNIIVYDYIREPIMEEIIDKQISVIANNILKAQGLELKVSDIAKQLLMKKSKQVVDFGGRGVINTLETELINKLAVFLTEKNAGSWTSDSIYVDAGDDGNLSIY